MPLFRHCKQMVFYASYYPVWKLEGLALLLFIACMTKAALFPLYISIPQTAKAPTAFFVLLGVILPCMTGIYAISRCAQLFATTSIVSHIALWIGLMTALFGALVAIFQYDIKKVVAYSVITHVGCAVALIGMGSYAAGVCYVLTSTCVHVLLGLGAGSIVRGSTNI
ncbi:MAG: proton-conducting transporter membrane subunit [Bdellovibrionota bacterium]